VTDYFLSVGGNDANEGTLAGGPWKTITRANSAMLNLGVGNRLLFRRGDLFYGQPYAPPSLDGNGSGWFTISSYGDEDQAPQISGYKNLNISAGWVQYDANTWSLNYSFANSGINYTGFDSKQNSASGEQDVGHLVINDVVFGKRKINGLADLSEQWDFWSSGTTLYVRSTANPTTLAADIKCNVDGSGIRITAATEVSDLHVLGHGAVGISMEGNSNRTRVLRNEVSHIGGPTYGTAPNITRYGNGIQCWTSSKDCTVELNKIHDIYDVAWSIQGGVANTNTHFQDITYHRNMTYRCSQAEEYWYEGNGAGFVNCLSEYNTNLFSGYGWGADVRPDQEVRVAQLAYHLGWNNTNPNVEINNVNMHRNIYYDARNAFSYISSKTTPQISDSNIVALRPGTPMMGHYGGGVLEPETVEQHASWTARKGRDQNTFFSILTASFDTDISDDDVADAIIALDDLVKYGKRQILNSRWFPIHAPWVA
jgi:hypothetical protein